MAVYDEQKLFESLKELQIISEKKLLEVFQTANKNHSSFAELLVEKDLISDENIGRIIANMYTLPFINLSSISISEDILKIIPEVVAKKQTVISFKKDGKGISIAMAEPENKDIVEFLKKKTGLQIIVHYATPKDIKNALGLYNKNITETFEQIILNNVDKAGKTLSKEDLPIIAIVEAIINYASQNKASDIHIEPQDNYSVIRFRIDGVLHDILNLPVEIHHQVVTRIKVLSKLRTDEHQSAQDGKMQVKTEEEMLDIRVSIVPITKGEKVVLRLLSEKSRQFSLSSLGLMGDDLTKVKNAFNKPYGMILSTGPTGCGKTTTMYAVLKLLNERNINIMTIEDPVEYEIQGVNQIQVNPKTELTFAKGLRSILRQDPNVILVGEIRDAETAGIAVNSAMTGHLVLSTLHTNDASTAIPRLIDMEIEPFLVSSTVNVIIGQRLVRKICLACRFSLEKDIDEVSGHFRKELIIKIFGNKKTLRIYQGKGCPVCHNTGYEDRIGIFETLLLDEKIKEAIMERKDAGTIREIAIKGGMKTMVEDGLQKIKEGITTIEEIIRVTKD